MTLTNPGLNNVNASLSFKKIKDFFAALPPEALRGGLAKKKEMTTAAVDYLDYFFDSKFGEVLTVEPCGPYPRIP